VACRRLLRRDEIALAQDAGGRRLACAACAGLGGLEFVPAGNPALTRRLQQPGGRAAVPVLEWHHRQRRHVRVGTLAAAAAVVRARAACLADADARAGRRQRNQVRLAREDAAYHAEFAAAVRARFPGCPAGEERRITDHACAKHSGRVGRGAAAKELSERAVTLAVVAWIRHQETAYDRLLAGGVPRATARERIRPRLREVLAAWRTGQATPAPAPAPATPANAELRARLDAAGDFFLD
jgi:hypothetical protein